MAKQNKLIQALKYLKRGPKLNEGWTEESLRSRDWEKIYRHRWQHDRVVRSTHGVNCTGSCSWKIHVKDGIITWETQQTDYPTIGEDFPEYEPRGCPRGATFSWYTYSPVRVRFPYVRSDLIKLWREECEKTNDPVVAWGNIVSNPEKKRLYQNARGKGGFIRTNWEEVAELIAASSIYTIKEYGPDRVTGFSPIPAMSMVSYAAGSRFLSLIGGTILSFYDWYADLPPASPQIWGEQTDVPESADWYNSKYMIIWGTNLPMTRTPDAHFMVEARYNGTKVIGVSPDYAEYEKFADIWLPAKAGTDGALAMAMTHVILKEFYVDKKTEYFIDYVKKYTDLPFMVLLKTHENGYVTDRFLHASDLNGEQSLGEWKTVFWDEQENRPVVPNGSLGFRWDKSQKWNLKLEKDDGTTFNPMLSFFEQADGQPLVLFPFFGKGRGEIIKRAVPAKKIKNANGEELLVTTVFDLLLAHVGVDRGLPGDYPKNYDDDMPYTPAWQESITGVNRSLAIQVAREFADNAERTKGKSMIAMGAGTNHWYHSDQIYRCMLNLVLLTGCQGVNGGGWAHYVGQEKVRPLEGWQQVAFASDWQKPSRLMNGTSFFYFATNQFRYEELESSTVGSPLGGRFQNMHPADMNTLAARLGWLPAYPQFTQNSLKIIKDAREQGAKTNEEIVHYTVKQITNGNLQWAIEDPDHPRNFPKILYNWRSNLLGASGKGHEYFLKHLLGADNQVSSNKGNWQPETVRISDEMPKGKLDLFISIDFRMTSSGLYADVVLPASTWYEKYDISSTDMHPFVHPFNAAISSPWEARSDWETFRYLSEVFSRLAKKHLPACDDLVMAPLTHDTAEEIAQPDGKVRDWRKGEVEAIPGKTMPKFVVVHREYPNIFDQMTTIGPNIEKGMVSKGIAYPGEEAYKDLIKRLGISGRDGIGKGRPDLYHDKQAIEAILTMSGATNGHRAVEGWESLSEVTGLDLTELAKGREEDAFTLVDITAQPKSAISTPVWSGLEKDGRRYSPFVVNKEYEVPWRTLTGRQHFYLDHEVMLDFGEGLPIFRPPLELGALLLNEKIANQEEKFITVRYLTPHQKWGIHTTYTDTPTMMTLFRGGQTIWINEKDAASIGIKDNQWVEVYNSNGCIACRAVLTYRIPEGVAMMYHAQDRVIGVPGTSNKKRGGTHNSVTRIIPKPTHMIGGYSQLSYNFNYYGPTGHQRDIITRIRPLKEVDWLES
ncbi:nitrate reductase subunit alpha [Fodinisporobacter ferrooxydans]|uniref:nitrate reductase (quinone) n=1 Tax=Fodinisporobacter ferrooxydans TaxID=2901836 RepID=A0ABY4CRM8_9BACL|nr:nitrate reductase subunit alpha [Alicyclobacillaceae bacterium MYW30-H2]